ncbi:MAG TPA: o-succinylbenzoate synthase [Longimicrobiales bacterium]|nr:o-succinylbenzoate synthase [Longimicrobiales bacterium]
MIIERIELQTIRLRLREPFRISSGVTWERRILLAKLDGDGLRGYGECVAGEAPNYSYETVETARLLLERQLVPALLGRELDGAREAAPLLAGAAKGHEMAKACLEMAAWDLDARARGVSLAALLGGVRDAVPTGVSIGIQESVEALLARIEGFLAEGYQRIKLKVAPGWDAPVIARVRERWPDVMLTVDANAAYQEDAAAPIEALDGFGLAMIEQPLPADDLTGMARLQARLRTPLCLDESVAGPGSCASALRLGSGRIVNIKPGRVGGLAASVAIHDMCRDAGVPVWCGGMLESGIGRAHNVALASLPNFRLPGDTSASRRYWERDVVEPAFELTPEGTVTVPDGVGIGVEVDEDFLASIQEERRVFEA